MDYQVGRETEEPQESLVIVVPLDSLEMPGDLVYRDPKDREEPL